MRLTIRIIALFAFFLPGVGMVYTADGSGAAQESKRLAPPGHDELRAQRPGDRVAVVVGVGNYPSLGGLSRLRFAAEDAAAIGRVLEQQGYIVNAFVTRKRRGAR